MEATHEITQAPEFRKLEVFAVKAKKNAEGKIIFNDLKLPEVEKTDELLLEAQVMKPEIKAFRKFKMKTADFMKRCFLLERRGAELEEDVTAPGWAEAMEGLNANYEKTLELLNAFAVPFLKKHGVEEDFDAIIEDAQMLIQACVCFIELWTMKEEVAKNL